MADAIAGHPRPLSWRGCSAGKLADLGRRRQNLVRTRHLPVIARVRIRLDELEPAATARIARSARPAELV